MYKDDLPTPHLVSAELDRWKQTFAVIMQISSVSTIYITPSGYHLLTCSDAHMSPNYSWGRLRS